MWPRVISTTSPGLSIKVTIVEPGGFRTDFAGSSTQLSEGHPAYDSTVGATARFQRNYNGKQPGDPKKAAQAIIQLTQERNPPLRLLLGSDAYAAVEKNDLARLEEARIWKELSVSTDFETEGRSGGHRLRGRSRVPPPAPSPGMPEMCSSKLIAVPQRQPKAGATVVRIASNTCAL